MRTALVLLALAAAAPLRAQGGGNGYLFGTPAAQITIRGGYAHPTAGSDLFDQVTTDLTLNRSSFSGFTGGGSVAVRLTSRFDVALDLDYAGMTKGSEYRGYVDNNNLPIQQTTSFQRVPVILSGRYYLAERGRSVGRLAWIPAGVVPWVGAGAGAMWYRFRQEGDFVNFNNGSVFQSQVETSGWAAAAQGMAGMDVTLTPRIAVTGDARYTWARAPLSGDFVGFQRLDLSGVSLTLGLTFRL
jgi:outer membrane protein W